MSEAESCIPYLVFCILGKVVQRRYVQLELARLAELAKTCSEGDEVWACNGDAEAHRLLRDIVDSVFLKSEAVGTVWAVDEVNEVFALEKK